MPLVIAAATSGSTTLQATDAVTATITLPSTTGTVQLTGGAVSATTIDASSTITGTKATGTILSLGNVTNSAGYNYAIGIQDGNGIRISKVGATNNTNLISQITRDDSQGNNFILYDKDGTTTGLKLAGGGATSSGAGITFPATQSASTNANTLDDYEEGNWTAAFAAATSGTVTINASFKTGWYQKVGNTVYFGGLFVVASFSAPVGALTITGLPFVSNSGFNISQSVAVYATLINSTVDIVQACIAPNTSAVAIERFNILTGQSAEASSLIKNSFQVRLNGSYITD